jgi:hypothetical protein
MSRMIFLILDILNILVHKKVLKARHTARIDKAGRVSYNSVGFLSMKKSGAMDGELRA